MLLIKTDMTIPYTSVFFELDCGYWNAEAEQLCLAKTPSAPKLRLLLTVKSTKQDALAQFSIGRVRSLRAENHEAHGASSEGALSPPGILYFAESRPKGEPGGKRSEERRVGKECRS